MLEMPLAGQDHRGASVIHQIDCVFVFERPTRVNDGGDAGIQEQFGAIGEREKRVAGGAEQHLVLSHHDRVALHVLADQPGEAQIVQFFFRRLARGDDFPIGLVQTGQVALLDEISANDLVQVQLGRVEGVDRADIEQADVLPSVAQQLQGIR